MYLVSDKDLGPDSVMYIVRAVFDHDADGEWIEDITDVWVKPMYSELDTMHHTLAYGPAKIYTQDNEHDAVDAWLQDGLSLLSKELRDDLTLYKSFNLI